MRPEIETERLILRRGAAEDFDAMHRIYGDPRVARMLASWPIPADPERTRAVCRPLPVDLGIAGPILIGGRIVGGMGCQRADEGDTFRLGYGLDPDFWGRGIATEMGAAIIDAVFARYRPAALVAEHFADNPASGCVLAKLGFESIGEGMGRSAARLEPAPVILYRLGRERFEGLA